MTTDGTFLILLANHGFPFIKLLFTHIYVEKHVIPAKAGIQRLANISYVYIEDYMTD